MPNVAPLALAALALALPLGMGSAAALEVAKGKRGIGAVTRSATELDALIAAHAQANGIPESLVHRVVQRESRYNPRAVGPGGVFGLMQIKPGTARALGYAGSPSGLLDAETNLSFGVRYLAGAYKVANGDPNRAVALFARGYYYEAKRMGLAGLTRAKSLDVAPVTTLSPVEVAAAEPPAPEPAIDMKAAWEYNR